MSSGTNGVFGGVVEQVGNTESARLRSLRVPVFAIDRLRMGTDSYGVTTLVAFMGCPLKCKYCLNPQCHEPIYEGERLRKGIMLLTPHELYELVKIDNIYFQATGGGICFGGGEPTMYVEFLESFRHICGRKWKLTLETCLSCSYRTIARLCHIVDYWIVDVKSMNPDIYRRYTGCQSAVEQHLAALKKLVSPDCVTVKVPSIEGFTVGCDLDADVDRIKQDFGFKDVVRIQYVNPSKLTDKKEEDYEYR